MASDYVQIGWAYSKSDPDTRYKLFRHSITGLLRCNCQAWSYSPVCHVCDRKLERRENAAGDKTYHCPLHGVQQQRSCKHLREWQAQQHTISPATVSPSYVPQPKPAKPVEPPEVGIVRTALRAAGLAARFSDWEVRALAKCLSAHINAPQPTPEALPGQFLVEGGLRVIVLED